MVGRLGVATVAVAVVLGAAPAAGKPLRPGDCAAAFNPGAGGFIAVASRHGDWQAAWQAAQALRKKKADVEVVPAALFVGQTPGWLVLLGAASARSDADKIAAAQPGSQVFEAGLVPDLQGPPVKPPSKQTVAGSVWDVAGDVVTIVEGRDIATVELRDGGKPAKTLKVLRGILRADAHLALVSKGDLWVLDEEAAWWRMVDGKPLGPLASADGSPPAQVSIGDLRFTRQHGAPGARGFLVERAGKRVGLLHLGFIEPFGSDGFIAGLPFGKEGKLTIAYARDLYRFDVVAEPQPARLVKLCGKIEVTGAAKPTPAPLRVTLPGQFIVTGDDGRFETWTGEWGLLRLGLAPAKESVAACGSGKKEYGPWNPGLGGGAGDDPVDVPLWGEPAVSVRIQARCAKP